jgi:RNA polymerase sigma-70 factor (ECF subfamily)
MADVAEQFGEIYDLYIEKIYRFVYLKVNNQEIAEDITSKVFLRGWEAFKTPKADIKNPGAFLYQIARNAVIDHYRTKDRTNTISAQNVPELADNRAGALDRAVLSAEVEQVKKAMQGLKKDYQDVLIWHYLDDMPVTQIAQILDKKEGAVRVMLHRGLRDLKGLIKES